MQVPANQSSTRRLSLKPVSDSSSLTSPLPRRHSLLRHRPWEMSQLNRTIDVQRPNNNIEIYFNRSKKYNYMKGIIDKYFQEEKDNPESKSTINSISFGNSNSSSQSQKSENSYKSIIPKISKNKEDGEKSAKQGFHLARRNLKDRKEDQPLLNSQPVKDPQSQPNQPQHEGELTQSIFLCQRSCVLPPIDEIMEDKDEHETRYDSISYINESVEEKPQKTVIKLRENEVYRVEVVMVAGRAVHKLKTYTDKGFPVLQRELKAATIGVKPYWIEYKYNPRALIAPPGPNLRELLFKAKRMDIQSKHFTLKPKKYHGKLLANSCEELKRVITLLCKSLLKVEGRLTNNSINASNLFLGKNQDLQLGEWGFASYRETHLIQGMEFENRLDPILKSQHEWLIPPEYMAPEVLRAVALGEQTELAELGSAPDIWCLGVCMFEIVTLIPVWMQQKCSVLGKEGAPRQGELAVSRDFGKMLKRQQKLPYLFGKILGEWPEIGQQIKQVICRCVEYLPQNRPSYLQIMTMLDNN